MVTGATTGAERNTVIFYNACMYTTLYTLPSEMQIVATLGILKTKSDVYVDEEKLTMKHSWSVSTTESDTMDTEKHCEVLDCDMVNVPLFVS